MNLIRLAAAALGALLSQLAFAQAYPAARPVSLIVPFPAGGGTDIVARLVAQKLSESLKGNFIVENKPGASAQIGNKFVVDAAPDGYTLLVATTSLMNGPALFGSKLPYDHTKQLRPVISLADLPIFLTISTKHNAKTVAEFVELMKKSSNVNYASAGPGTSLHMSAEWFKQATGIQATHIPFKGSAPSILAVAGGQVDFNAENLGPALPLVKQGSVRLLAVAAHQRHPLEPAVPTFKEAGLPDVNLSTWIFLMAPAATPDAVVQLVNRAANDILKTDEMRDKLLQQGFVRTGGTIPEMEARMKAETELWGTVIRRANIKVD